MLHSTNALEQNWLVKIILKDLKIGTHEKILSCFHPKAQELFYNTNNLREVFSKLKDPNVEIGTTLFQLHRPIKPMLAARKPYKEILKQLINADVFVETKFDGERIQVHF
jgi:ATP-dependent DNA ligase